MGFLDNMGKTISDASQGALKKGREMADVAKFNSLISDEEKRITGLYEQIGKKYVEVFGDSSSEDFTELLAALQSSKEKIEEYRKNIAELKGVSNCPVCGAEVANNALFCAVCGAKMSEQAAEPVAEPVTEEVHCAGCGTVIAPGSRFCTTCGKPV